MPAVENFPPSLRYSPSRRPEVENFVNSYVRVRQMRIWSWIFAHHLQSGTLNLWDYYLRQSQQVNKWCIFDQFCYQDDKITMSYQSNDLLPLLLQILTGEWIIFNCPKHRWSVGPLPTCLIAWALDRSIGKWHFLSWMKYSLSMWCNSCICGIL